MGTAPRQKKIDLSAEPQEGDILVERSKIDAVRLYPWESAILLHEWRREINSAHTIFFRKTEAVCEVLRKHKLLNEGE